MLLVWYLTTSDRMVCTDLQTALIHEAELGKININIKVRKHSARQDGNECLDIVAEANDQLLV